MEVGLGEIKKVKPPVLYRYTVYKGYIMREIFERVEDRLELKRVEIKHYKNLSIEYIGDMVDIIIDIDLISHRANEAEIYYELSERVDCNCECGRGW
jgi:hypothetical protein